MGGRWGGAYTLLLTLVKSRRLTTSANSNRLRSLRSKRLSYDCTRTSSPVPSQKRLGSCTSLSLSLFTHDNQLSGQVPSAAIAKLIRLKELQLGASPQRAVIPPLSQRSGSGICASAASTTATAAATGNCGSAPLARRKFSRRRLLSCKARRLKSTRSNHGKTIGVIIGGQRWWADCECVCLSVCLSISAKIRYNSAMPGPLTPRHTGTVNWRW